MGEMSISDMLASIGCKSTIDKMSLAKIIAEKVNEELGAERIQYESQLTDMIYDVLNNYKIME